MSNGDEGDAEKDLEDVEKVHTDAVLSSYAKKNALDPLNIPKKD